MNRRRFGEAVFATALCAAVPAARAQRFPNAPIALICPWPAGGGTDTLLRALGKATERVLGQPVNVVNVSGGGGAVGHSAILDAAPDGYTVGMITFELNSLPAQKLVPFNYTDFEPLMRINTDAAALTVRSDAPFNSLKAFIDHARSHPNDITVGNSGPGSVWHIAAGLMARRAEIRIRHVPYDGAAPAIAALAGGHIRAVAVSVPEVRAQVMAGNLKILGVMDSQRSAVFPDVPTFAEQGVTVIFHTWRGLALPNGVPVDVRVRLHDAFKKALDSAEIQDFARRSSLNLSYQSSEEFAKFLSDNYADVTAVMKTLGLTRR